MFLWGSGDRGEAQVFVYTRTTISGHSWAPPLSWAELGGQAAGLCVQKLLSVLTFTELVQVSLSLWKKSQTRH